MYGITVPYMQAYILDVTSDMLSICDVTNSTLSVEDVAIGMLYVEEVTNVASYLTQSVHTIPANDVRMSDL